MPGNREGAQRHLDGHDGIWLLFHFCTGSQTLLRELSVMKLAQRYGQVRNMIASANMIVLKAKGANLPRRTNPLVIKGPSSR